MQADIPTFPPGWKVFPCQPGSKFPIEGFTDWPSRATNDPAQIEAWANEYSGCNWAVALGPSGLAVVDIDPPTGEDSLLQYELAHEPLPPTREHRSARGGRHLIYRDDFLLCPNSVSKLGPKLDTRGQNGYIIIPPSTFEGGRYELTENRDIAELPDFVSADAGKRREHVEAAAGTGMDSDSALGRARRLLCDYVERGDVAREGQGGDNRTYQVCAEVINLGLSPGRAFELIDTIWNVACVPPWSPEELFAKCENAATYAQNDAGAWAVLPVTEAVPAQVLDSLRREAASAKPPEPAEQARFHWMAEDEFRNMPPPVWLIEDMLTTNSVNMLYGPSGHYKSFIAMNIACSVALADKCAFYVAAEGIARMARKDFPAWKIAYGAEKPIPFFMTDDMPIWDESEFDYKAFSASIAAKAEAEGRPVGIIFFDTLNRALIGLEENSASDMAKFIRIADKIRRAFRCAVVLVHHTPADGKDPRGSSALYAGCDTVLKVIADKDVKVVRMHVTKQKTSEERDYPFCYQGHKYGMGLAFLPVTTRDAAVLTDQTNAFSTRAIVEVLTRLDAHEPNGIPSRALVMELFPQRQDESLEAYNDVIAQRARALAGVVKKGKLDGFFSGVGAGLRWGLPSR